MQEADLNELLAAERRARSRQERRCPPADWLVAAAARELPESRREEVAAHLATCPDCAAEYSLARELRGWAEETASRGARPPRARSRVVAGPWVSARVRRWLPVAAGIAFVVVGLAVFELRRLDPEPREVRGVTAPAEWRVSPADEARVRGRPERLEWPAIPGAESYRVVLYDHESRQLWQSERLEQNAVELPGEVAVAPGRVYYWRVFARRELSEERSPLFSFRLEP